MSGGVGESVFDLISALVIHVIHISNGKCEKRKIKNENENTPQNEFGTIEVRAQHGPDEGVCVCVCFRWVIAKFYSIQLSYSNEAIIFNELIECKYFVRVNAEGGETRTLLAICWKHL